MCLLLRGCGCKNVVIIKDAPASKPVLNVGLDVDVLIVRTLDLDLMTKMKMAYNSELVIATDGDKTTSASDHEENLSEDD